ncbi:MAG: hypothetical protein ACNA71_05985 [Kiritimatiellia bacterium]
MIRACFFIARTTIRHAWHNRAIGWIMLATGAVSIGMPLMLTGGGSPEGAWSMQMTYTPILLFAILATSSVWLGAYSLSTERLQMTLAMLKTKPVSGFSIWFGKWLGVCAIHAAAMILSGTVFGGMIFLLSGPDQSASHTFWQPFYPDESELFDRANTILAEWPTSDAPEAPPAPTPEQVVNRLRQQQYRVAPAQTVQWHIPVSSRSVTPRPWRIQFHWRLDPMRRSPASGTWMLHAPGQTEPIAMQTITGKLDGTHVVTWEQSTPAASPTLTLSFQAAPDNQSHVFFDIRNPVSLQQAASSLGPNLLRTGAIAMTFCAAIAALALLFSACLSFPVAVFATYGTLFALVIASVAGQEQLRMGHSHDHGDGHGNFAELLLEQTSHFLDKVHALTHGLREALPFRALANHIHIALRDHAPLLMILLVLCPLAGAILAHLKISHEEVH